MKNKEQLKILKNKSEKELAKELNESYSKLQKLKFSTAFGKLKNLNEISKTRHQIARIWTILQSKSENNKQVSK